MNLNFNSNYQMKIHPLKFHLILKIDECIQKLYKLMDLYQ